MKLALSEIELWCGGRPGGARPPADRTLAEGYSIDSRTIRPGEIFFALRGERFDGHDFLDAVFAAGALAAVVEEASVPVAALGYPLIFVDDPLAALEALATAVRRQWGGRLIGLTGSAGKTTTKDAVAAVLAARFRVLKSEGNLNNHIGLPLQLLRLEPGHEVAVIEMGMNHAGEIAALCRIAQPDWGVVTNVGTAHMQNFADGQAGIARAKYELVAALPAHGTAFLNCDDAYVGQFGRDFRGRAIYFGTGPCADPAADHITETAAGAAFDLVWRGQQYAVKLQLMGRHNVLNALAGLAVGLEAGVAAEDAVAAVAALEPPDRRGQRLAWRGATIINDCYNSNPEALEAMIRTLAALEPGPGGRRILAAGEMLELGPQGGQAHRAAGALAAELGIDQVIGVRGSAAALAEGARAGGVPALFVETPQEAGRWLRANLRAGDIALLKASRGVRLEQALEALGS